MLSRKVYFDGTHRTRSPAETYGEYARLMPRLGITRLANVTGLDHVGVPVFMAVRPNARTLAVSQGKGVTVEAARVSALMESLELWHAEHATLPLCRDTYASLRRRARVIEIDRLNRVCAAPPRHDEELYWVEGHDVIQGCPTWVPDDVARASSLVDVPAVFRSSSNGLASGNTRAEAILHALCELIERDAHALWVHDPRDPDGKKSQLDLATVGDATCRRLLEMFARARLVVSAYDMTSDLGVPAYIAMLSDCPGQVRPVGIFSGAGAHLSPAVALARALTEAAQSRLTVIAGSRDDLHRRHYERVTDEALCDHAREVETPLPDRSFSARTSLATECVDDDVEVLVAALRGAGLTSAVVIDLAQPAIDVPVVKVVVPGLESMRAIPGARIRAMQSQVA